MASWVYWTLAQLLARVTQCNGKSPQKVNSDSGLHDASSKIMVFQFHSAHVARFILSCQPGVPSVGLTQHLDSPVGYTTPHQPQTNIWVCGFLTLRCYVHREKVGAGLSIASPSLSFPCYSTDPDWEYPLMGQVPGVTELFWESSP